MLKIREPKRIEVAAFLAKKARREYNVPVKFVGFEVPNVFVVGYGLDYKQMYRNLPFVIGMEE